MLPTIISGIESWLCERNCTIRKKYSKGENQEKI